jgi:hypothetical protein
MADPQKISGVVFKILAADQGTGKKGAWVKQSFIIETKDQYPKKIMFQAWNDKCDIIPEPGTEVTVSYNPESREYNDKWYTDLNMWAIDSGKTESKPEKKAPVKTGLKLEEEDLDELPF